MFPSGPSATSARSWPVVSVSVFIRRALPNKSLTSSIIPTPSLSSSTRVNSFKKFSVFVISYRDFIARGQKERAQLASLLKERAESAKPDDIAIMVYTSGTTGAPKGACLSHRYIINSVESLRQTIPIYDTDVSFSYLPFCHVAERISGLYNRLYAGASA